MFLGYLMITLLTKNMKSVIK